LQCYFDERQFKVTDIVPIEEIAGKIYFIRGVKVMIDRDPAVFMN